MKIKDILLPGLITISREASMADAEKLLREKKIRHLPVSDGRSIIGILSEKDIDRAKTLIHLQDKTETVIQGYKRVSDYMTTPVLSLSTVDSVEHLTREMIRLKVSSFIINDETGRPVGIITTHDLLTILLDKINPPRAGGIFKKIMRQLFTHR
jgi:acetoin utilization protein AcuB